MKYIALKLIKFYQLCISPYLGSNCRFIPTCSQYTYRAIELHGFFKGIGLGIIRILKCNPFHKPMCDFVPEKKGKSKNGGKK